MRAVHVPVRDIEEKRFVLVLVDEFHGAIGHGPRHGDTAVMFFAGAVIAVAGTQVEALGVRAQVPLADARGGVARGLEHLGDAGVCPFDRVVARFHGVMLGVATTGRDQEAHEVYAALGLAARRVELGARRVHAGHDAGACGRAIGSTGVELVHDHPVVGERVEVRALRELGAVEAYVAPAQVVGQDKYDVGLYCAARGRSGRCEQGGEEDYKGEWLHGFGLSRVNRIYI